MRRPFIATSALALLFALVGFATAQTKPEPTDRPADRPEMKAEMGSTEGAIIRLFKDEKLVEYKVEKIVEKEGEKKMADRFVRPGCIIFLHVADSRVLDERGVELKRDDKTAWFTKDAGWAALKEGRRLRIDYTGSYEVPAPKDFPKEARTGGNILVYHCTLVQILAEEHKG